MVNVSNGCNGLWLMKQVSFLQSAVSNNFCKLLAQMVKLWRSEGSTCKVK